MYLGPKLAHTTTSRSRCIIMLRSYMDPLGRMALATDLRGILGV